MIYYYIIEYLHKKQQLLKYTFYCINKIFKKKNDEKKYSIFEIKKNLKINLFCVLFFIYLEFISNRSLLR